jgi:hypothetical protein
LFSFFSEVGGRCLAAHLGEDVVESFVSFLGLLAVAVDPLRHQVEDLGLEVAWPPLRVAALGDEPGVGEHLHVLGHCLRLGELPHGGIAHGEAGHHAPPRGIGEGGEHPRQLVIAHGTSSCSTDRLITTYATVDGDVNRLVEKIAAARHLR